MILEAAFQTLIRLDWFVQRIKRADIAQLTYDVVSGIAVIGFLAFSLILAFYVAS